MAQPLRVLGNAVLKAVINSVKLRLSLQDNIFSTTQVIQIILRNPKVHCYVHTSRHWFLFWATWIGSTPSHTVVLRYILILYSYLYLDIGKVISLLSLLTKAQVFLVRATCCVYLIIRNLIIITIFGEEIRWRVSYSCVRYEVFTVSYRNNFTFYLPFYYRGFWN